MIEAKDINDRDSLEQWLTEWPKSQGMSELEARQIAVQIAHRAAMRVLPIAWEWFCGEVALEDSRSVLPILRCLAVTGGISACPIALTSRFRITARAAYIANKDVGQISDVFAAAVRVGYCKANIQRDASDAVFGTPLFAYPSVRAEVVADASSIEIGRDLAQRPLWSNTIPEIVRRSEMIFRESVEGKSVLWRFWLRYFETSKLGELLPCHLLFQVASIQDEDWARGPLRVSELIAEIESAYQVDQIIADNPLGQRIVRSRTTGALTSEPIENRDLSSIVKDIQRSLREFNSNCKKERGNLGLALVDAYAPHLDELRKRMSKNKDNPRELLRSIEEAHRAFHLVAKTEAALEHVQVDRLLNGLQDRAADVGVSAPEVMDEIKRRRAVKVQLMTDQQITLAVRMSAGMAADSRGLLQAAISRALLVVASDEATDEEKAAAWTFLLGAIPRGAKLKHEAGEAGTDASKDSSAVDTVVGYADKLNKLDKGVDAIQEAASEGGPWVTEVFTQVGSGNFWGIF
ncbi:hypothetical protein [Planktotalea sp.]|uniref:hypothetical protein n=1 Tax=Planktotalea sp. TaxID=2029877 RepID=UPI003D6BB78F